MIKKLDRPFFEVNSYNLATSLLGKIICILRNGSLEKYRIVETEAYGGAVDKASHAYNNLRTKRTESLYLEGGHLYVHLIYGMYYMLNIVANSKDVPEGVLIRAVEPLVDHQKKVIATNGPGKLCKYLSIDKRFDKEDLVTSSKIYVASDDYEPFEITASKRIGIDYAGSDKDLQWRFYISGNPYVSKRN